MAKINEYLEILLQRQDLTFDQAKSLLDTVFDGQTPPARIAAFLTAMRIKGAKPAELAGLASSLRNHAVRVQTPLDNLIDTCGAGGARLKTFNISTAAAIVAAGAGAHVAKHGNRGITSKCGSADVLAELGVKIDCGPDRVAECITAAHIGFMFAPMFHPAMKYVQPIRKELGFRTVFNILGPLANPAFAAAQVMGVPDESLMPTIAQTLDMLGVKRAMVAHSDGLDEISTMGPTKVLHLKDGQTTESTLDPSDYGIAQAEFQALAGGDARTNAAIIKDILSGADTGPRKDIVVINAAAAIIVAGLADEFAQAIEIAEEAIANGKAEEALEKMITISNA
ncbi:MAG: anthranilate phosphoribosyltransferase [Planctomycetota bacterium]|nr:MAG: anthranilate phosphoribosyltransferase [Planctomycetota bacterium]